LLKEPTEDEHDAFIENINLALILSIGILSLSVSAMTLIQSATTAVLSQQLPTDSLEKLVFAALLLVIGYTALHVFQKRRESRRNKQSALFLRTKT
jgi:uncharacterized membrane protein YfcA